MRISQSSEHDFAYEPPREPQAVYDDPASLRSRLLAVGVFLLYVLALGLADAIDRGFQ